MFVALLASLLPSLALSMRTGAPPMRRQPSSSLAKPGASGLAGDGNGVVEQPQRFYGDQILGDAEYAAQSRRAFLLGGSGALLSTCGCAAVAGKQGCFANMMAEGMKDYESLPEVQSFKRELFSNIPAGAEVLEIGVGSGPNLKLYGSKAKKVVALEPNRSFDKFILEAAIATNTNIEIVPGFAEKIPLPDNSIEIVVGTMVMCSVHSVKESLSEVRRVLKPGGKYLFTEHVRAPDNMPLLGAAQAIADPLQNFFAEGCHLQRNPSNTIDRTFGQSNVEAREFVLSSKDSTSLLPPHFLLSPHMVGCATKG